MTVFLLLLYIYMKAGLNHGIFSSDWCNIFGNSILFSWNFIFFLLRKRPPVNDLMRRHAGKTKNMMHIKHNFIFQAADDLLVAWLFLRKVVSCPRHVLFHFCTTLSLPLIRLFPSYAVTHSWAQHRTSTFVMSPHPLTRLAALLPFYLRHTKLNKTSILSSCRLIVTWSTLASSQRHGLVAEARV